MNAIRIISGIIFVASVALLLMAALFWKTFDNQRAGEVLGLTGGLFFFVGGIPLVLTFVLKDNDSRN